ncbi:MAG: export ABC transporter ATP-binding protein, partial [Acidimicrobiia bacterium]
ARVAGDLAGVSSASTSDEGLEILASDAGSLLPSLLGKLAGTGLNVTGVQVIEPNLEAVFLHLTGKALRD